MSDIEIQPAVSETVGAAPAPPGVDSSVASPPPPGPAPAADAELGAAPPPPPASELPPALPPEPVQSPVQSPPTDAAAVMQPGQPGADPVEAPPVEASPVDAPPVEAPPVDAGAVMGPGQPGAGPADAPPVDAGPLPHIDPSCAEACARVENELAELPPDLPPTPDSFPPEFDEDEPVEYEATPELSEEDPVELDDVSLIIGPGQPGSSVSDDEVDGLVELDPDQMAACASEIRDVCSGYEQVAVELARPVTVSEEVLAELRRVLEDLIAELSGAAAEIERRGASVAEPFTPVAAPM